jgi:hypothetical protein
VVVGYFVFLYSGRFLAVMLTISPGYQKRQKQGITNFNFESGGFCGKGFTKVNKIMLQNCENQPTLD